MQLLKLTRETVYCVKGLQDAKLSVKLAARRDYKLVQPSKESLLTLTLLPHAAKVVSYRPSTIRPAKHVLQLVPKHETFFHFGL